MAFPLVRGHSVQQRQRVYASLHEREIFACGIQNPGLWNPSSTDKDWNSVSEIRNPRRGIQNPRLSCIPRIPLRGTTP